MNATPLKRYTSQILSYKILSFCEQILKIGANDASGKMLQIAPELSISTRSTAVHAYDTIDLVIVSIG